jgi:exosortase/archaeosortase family protein
LPPIARAGIAAVTVLFCFYFAAFGKHPPLALCGLTALTLPVLPSLQFTLGYPMRIISAALAVPLLQAHGLDVAQQGTFLLWREEMIQFDAPCSGVNMLWAGLLLTLMACVLLRLHPLKVMVAVALSLLLAIACNVLSASSLFYVEAHLVARAPAWWHEGIGIAAFAHCRGDAAPSHHAAAVGAKGVVRLIEGLKVAAFALAALAAALAPLWPGRNQTAATDVRFTGWPVTYEGRALTQMPLTPRELAFARDFPGQIGRFFDGKREIIIRWIGVPTRRLHSATDCLRGIGYGITPLPARNDVGGRAMACLRAGHGADLMTVCELIRDERGAAFPDVSAWYWNALLGATQGPWWSFVVAENLSVIPEPERDASE